MNVVYVQATTKDSVVRDRLAVFYANLMSEGLTYNFPILDENDRNMALIRCPELRGIVNTHPLTPDDIAIWTEWSGSDEIDAFFRGPKHAQFTSFANATLDMAIYRIIQYRDGHVRQRVYPG